MKKEFGSISAQQIKEFYKIFSKFIDELSEDLDNNPVKFEDIQSSITWHQLYELKDTQICGYLFLCLNLEDEIQAGIKSREPIQHILNLFTSGFVPDVDINDFDPQKLVNFYTAMICTLNNLECYATYRTSINQLMQEAKYGSDDSLLKAINVDTTVVCTETASKRISLASLKEDGVFIDQLSRAVKGSYPKNSAQKYPELNFFVYMIESIPDSNIDMEALHKLFTIDLPLYPDVNESKDSFGSFKKQIERTKHRVKDMKS